MYSPPHFCVEENVLGDFSKVLASLGRSGCQFSHNITISCFNCIRELLLLHAQGFIFSANVMFSGGSSRTLAYDSLNEE